MRDASLPSVAVVIPTYNRSRLLRRSLQALRAVDYPAFEVVVIDDGSREDEFHANERATHEAGARLLRQANSGPAAARNRGVAATHSDLVTFLDDDCAPTPSWLQELVRPFAASESDRLAAVGGSVRSERPSTWIGRYCAAARYSTGAPEEITNAATANACYRRSVLEEVDGFDESFRHPGGDDPDLARRVLARGYTIERAPGSVVLHAEISTLSELLTHMYWRGLGEAKGKRKEGRLWWVLLRAVLVPLFLGRRIAQTWRFSSGHGGFARRAGYAGFEAVVSLVFVASSVLGFLRRTE